VQPIPPRAITNSLIVGQKFEKLQQLCDFQLRRVQLVTDTAYLLPRSVDVALIRASREKIRVRREYVISGVVFVGLTASRQLCIRVLIKWECRIRKLVRHVDCGVRRTWRWDDNILSRAGTKIVASDAPEPHVVCWCARLPG